MENVYPDHIWTWAALYLFNNQWLDSRDEFEIKVEAGELDGRVLKGDIVQVVEFNQRLHRGNISAGGWSDPIEFKTGRFMILECLRGQEFYENEWGTESESSILPKFKVLERFQPQDFDIKNVI